MKPSDPPLWAVRGETLCRPLSRRFPRFSSGRLSLAPLTSVTHLQPHAAWRGSTTTFPELEFDATSLLGAGSWLLDRGTGHRGADPSRPGFLPPSETQLHAPPQPDSGGRPQGLFLTSVLSPSPLSPSAWHPPLPPPDPRVHPIL